MADHECNLSDFVQKKLLEILQDQGLSETHLMAETWTQLEGELSGFPAKLHHCFNLAPMIC